MLRYLFAVVFCLLLVAVNPVFAQDEADVTAGEDAAAQGVAEETAADEDIADEAGEKTKAFDLGVVVVEGKAVANVERGGTTTIITADDIDAYSHKSLGDALKLVPGIRVPESGRGLVDMTMRGFRDNEVMFLVDGMPVLDGYEKKVDLSKIPVDNVAKIVVTRGSASALYGSGGAVGVINVITKKPEKLFARVSGEYGQSNNYTVNVAQGAPIGDFYYWLTASVKNSDGYDISGKLDKEEKKEWVGKLSNYELYGYTIDQVNIEALDDYLEAEEWPNTEYRKYQIDGKMGYAINSNLEIGLSANYYNGEQKAYSPQANCFSSYDAADRMWSEPSDYSFDESISLPQNVRSREAVFEAGYNEWPTFYNYTIAPYFIFEKQKISVKGNVFYRYQKNLYEAYNDAAMTELAWPEFFVGDWIDTTYGANVLTSYSLLPWNRLSGAVKFRYDDHLEKSEDGELDKGIVKGQELTVAVEDEMVFMDKRLQITAGVSYDASNISEMKERGFSRNAGQFTWADDLEDIDKVEEDSMLWGKNDAFNPVLTVVYEAVKDFLKLRANASMKSRFATMGDYRNVVLEGKLKAERSRNFGGGFEMSFLDSKLNWRTDYFYSYFTDKIETAWDTESDDKVAGNIGKVYSQGFETTIAGNSKKVIDLIDLMYSLSYAYVNRENDNDVPDSEFNRGESEEDIPVHQVIADIRFAFPTGTYLNISGVYEAGAIKYVMKERPQTDTSEEYSTEYFKEVELHDPLKINIKLSQDIMENFNIYVMCKNVLDDYDADPFNPGPGRMFYFGGEARL